MIEQSQRSGAGAEARIAVVGGGVSGLSVAWYLERQGHAVEVYEAADRLGGRVATHALGSRPVTLGGKNIGRRYHRFRAFVADHGNHGFEHFGINTSREEHGRLLTIDSTRRAASVRNFLAQASARDTARLARWVRAIKADDDNRFLRGPYWAPLSERKDDRPLTGHLSEDMCRSIIRTMTVRINGAEPDEVYLGTFGTNLGMLLDTYEQLTDGFEPVLAEFARRHAVRLGARVLRLLVEGDRVAGVEAESEWGVERERYDAIVIATPARAAAPLLAPFAPTLAERLREVRYFPATTLVVEYDRDVFSPEIRAIAFGPGHQLSNAGAYGIHDLRTVRYTFSGRAARGVIAVHGHDHERLAGIAEEHLQRHFPVRDAKRLRLVGCTWDPSFCAFVPRHGPFLDGLDREVEAIPGLHLTGDYFRGASIEACFRAGEDCAAKVQATLTRLPTPVAAASGHKARAGAGE
jgi:protoporphyrinogen/coproporphyrinogen III oxidase